MQSSKKRSRRKMMEAPLYWGAFCIQSSVEAPPLLSSQADPLSLVKDKARRVPEASLTRLNGPA